MSLREDAIRQARANEPLRPYRIRNAKISPSKAGPGKKELCYGWLDRYLTRFGRTFAWSFLISNAVTLQYSKSNERKFFRGFRYCNPSLVIQEFETFRHTNNVSPAFSEENFIFYNLWMICRNFMRGHWTLPTISAKSQKLTCRDYETIQQLKCKGSCNPCLIGSTDESNIFDTSTTYSSVISDAGSREGEIYADLTPTLCEMEMLFFDRSSAQETHDRHKYIYMWKTPKITKYIKFWT